MVKHRGKLGQAHRRKVGRPQPQKSPLRSPHLTTAQLVLRCQQRILASQQLVVRIVYFLYKKAGLTEYQCFHLLKVIAVLHQYAIGQRLRELKKRVGVDFETKIATQHLIAGFLPVTLVFLQCFKDHCGLLFQPRHERLVQHRYPHQRGHVGNSVGARYLVMAVYNALIPQQQGGRYTMFQFEGRHTRAVGAEDRLVLLPYHMQHNIVIGSVLLMFVLAPAR